MITTTKFLAIIFSLIFSIVFPIILFKLAKKKYELNSKPFLIGCLTFFISAGILESIFHNIILSTKIGETITNNIFLYALYGGLAAAIFEETARFIALNQIFKSTRKKENAIMYGIGHGGIECIMVLTIASINNIITAIMINTGYNKEILNTIKDENISNQMQSIFNTLLEVKSYEFFLGDFERIIAIFLQISFSMIVYIAIRKNKNYLKLAYLIHFLIDFSIVIIQKYTNSNILTLLILAVFSYIITYFTWKKFKNIN